MSMSIEQNSHLNNLVHYLYDSRNGYKECAEVVKDDRLGAVFTSLSAEREEMIKELRETAKEEGIELSNRGTLGGPLHRLLLDLKALITRHDNDAVIKEIKRGESTLLEAYKETIRDDFPMGMEHILERQMTEIQTDLNDIDMISLKKK